MLQIQKMEPKDFPFAVELANTMNWHMTPEDYAFNRSLEPEGCLVLREDSKLVGVATCISYGQVGWFGNLVVKEAHRRRGAGATLVNHAVNYLKNAGATNIGLYAYPHLKKFYGELGFESDAEFVVLKADSVSSFSFQDANLRAIKPQDIPTVAEFDGRCFGGSRKKLLELSLQNPANLGYIAYDGSELVGYGAAKVYGETAEVGPLFCQKNSGETATALLRTLLSKLEGVEAYIYLPAAETALINVARESGFREEFGLLRMFLGSPSLQDCIHIPESLERG
ncbi:MAG: GNAT family N-acetyltransferase [Candidatus Bathyarchaeota archaeon]|nr:GNAT family N-acetyltransferase [Candidatus Bathyarchaeota archaeon]